jgi:hypothetical protein
VDASACGVVWCGACLCGGGGMPPARCDLCACARHERRERQTRERRPSVRVQAHTRGRPAPRPAAAVLRPRLYAAAREALVPYLARPQHARDAVVAAPAGQQRTRPAAPPQLAGRGRGLAVRGVVGVEADGRARLAAPRALGDRQHVVLRRGARGRGGAGAGGPGGVLLLLRRRRLLLLRRQGLAIGRVAAEQAPPPLAPEAGGLPLRLLPSLRPALALQRAASRLRILHQPPRLLALRAALRLLRAAAAAAAAAAAELAVGREALQPRRQPPVRVDAPQRRAEPPAERRLEAGRVGARRQLDQGEVCGVRRRRVVPRDPAPAGGAGRAGRARAGRLRGAGGAAAERVDKRARPSLSGPAGRRTKTACAAPANSTAVNGRPALLLPAAKPRPRLRPRRRPRNRSAP